MRIENLKRIFLFIFYLLPFIFLLGCSVKTTPIYAVIKTPEIKVADQGFLKEGFGYKQIIIYKAANAPIKITVKNSQICLNGRCMDKENFIKSLSRDYPVNLIDSILEKKPVDFLGKIIKEKDSFYQKTNRFYYRVSKKSVLFKDKKKKIIIMIKDLK